jgi:hypothetical protein
LSVTLVAPGFNAADTSSSVPAHFRVADIVHRSGVLPFAATIDGFGNSLVTRGSGFEPVAYRDRVSAAADAADRILVDPRQLSHYETLREGFWDGADVRVYRVIDGTLQMTRRDRVAEGGMHASGWWPLQEEGRMIPAGVGQFWFRWDSWARPEAPAYFSVRAVDRAGRLSAPSAALRVASPSRLVQQPVDNPLQSYSPDAAASPLRPPAGLRGSVDETGLLVLEWLPDPASGLAGYRVYRSEHPPEQHRGFALDLVGRAGDARQRVIAGDMVILTRRVAAPSRRRMLSDRVWNAGGEYRQILPGMLDWFPDEHPGKRWSLVTHESDTPVEEAGETFLRVELGPGERANLTSWNHSGTSQSWYPVLERRKYRFELWLRQQGSGRASFRLRGPHQGTAGDPGPVLLAAGSSWRRLSGSFTPTDVPATDRPGAMEIELVGPGTFDLDNFRVFRADTRYLDLDAGELGRLRDDGLLALRTHATVKTGFATYDMAQLTNPGGVVDGIRGLNTLPQMLRNFRGAGVRPWLQIEYHMAPEEWLGLIEYLAAPFDAATDRPEARPWAYKRWQQGQQRPWVEEFEQIYLELSNETWNRLFRPWNFDAMRDARTGRVVPAGGVYGLFQEQVREIMRTSPYWKSADLERRLVFVLGGWGGQGRFSLDAARASPSASILALADYNGGWDAGEGPPAADTRGYVGVLSHTVQSTLPGAEREAHQLQELAARSGGALRLGAYEAGPGYALNGLNGVAVSPEADLAQERVMKSLAAGTATLDAFLARAMQGYAVQTYYALGRGSHWASHAPWYRGGQAYPSWKAIALFNAQGTGELLRVDALSVPTATLGAYGRRVALSRAPLVAAYASRDGDRLSVFVLSRKVPDYPLPGEDGYVPVTVDLPIRGARRLTLYRMTGAPGDNNLLSDNVRIDRIELPAALAGPRLRLDAAHGADERGLPPASTFVYVFEGIEPAARPAP